MAISTIHGAPSTSPSVGGDDGVQPAGQVATTRVETENHVNEVSKVHTPV